MSDIVQRLRRKTVAGQPVFPTPLDIEAANEIERLRARVGRDVGDFDYPPGSAPCMCFFSTAEDRGPDPLGECDYHRRLRAQLADLQGERDVAELSRDAAHARLAECESQLRAVALKPGAARRARPSASGRSMRGIEWGPRCCTGATRRRSGRW